MKRYRNAVWFTLKANNVYALLWRKDKKMNQNNPFVISFEGEIIAEPVVPEIENLVEWGFTTEEIVSLVSLQQSRGYGFSEIGT